MIGYGFSSLVYTTESDSEWLTARFFEMSDILEDSPIFQAIIKEGLAKG